MGYTHYWSKNREFSDTEWAGIRKAARRIIKTAHDKYLINLVWEYDKPHRAPQLDNNVIRFNGHDDDGHETFYFHRRESEYEFCKTNRKDYNAPVAAILMAAKHVAPDAFSWRSDGWVEDSETQDAVRLVNEACELGLEITNADPNGNDPYYKEQQS